MKKRLAALLLCLCFFLGIGCISTSAESDVCFISVNDTLLELSSMPYFVDGVTYVPYYIFTNYNFGIYYNYFASSSTAQFYNASGQLIFDLSEGTCYDGNDTSYSYKAIMRNGTVYVPAAFICGFFEGISCTYVNGYSYGDVLRIKDSSAFLTDSQFVAAASTLMEQRYDSYKASLARPEAEAPPEDGEISGSGITVILGFSGLPDSALLTTLDRFGAKACFYLSYEDVLSQPETVRMISGQGHGIGVLCGETDASDFDSTAGLIYEAAKVKTIMAAGSGLTPSDDSGIVCSSWDINAAPGDSGYALGYNSIVSSIERRSGDFSLYFSCAGTGSLTLASVLSYLLENEYTVRAPRETD